MTTNNGQPPTAEEALEEMARQRFQQHLAQHDQATRHRMVQAMRDNDADPAYIHAFEKTGLLVFQETLDLLDPEQLEQWAQAYEEYSSE